jgi:tRNA(fMet)-specific endonuclease VapC
LARIIDTSVFIEIERTGRSLEAIIAGALTVRHAIASITASELLFGVERANTVERRRRRSAFVEAVLTEIPVVPLDVDVARTHARIWALLEATGARIGPYDMIVAATALAKGYDVLTLNTKEFERVPGFTVHRPEWQD